MFLKYSQSGVLQWQRYLDGINLGNGSQLRTDPSGNMYVGVGDAISGVANNGMSIIKLPGDGSLTGQYGTISYQPSTLSESALSYSFLSSQVSYSTVSVPNTFGTLTAEEYGVPFSRKDVG